MNLRRVRASARRHLVARAPLAGAAAILAAIGACSKPAPPEKTVEGVAKMLGAAAGGVVKPDDFVWEEREGFLADALFGRRVLFLAKHEGSDKRDLYRARVRVTRSGQPLGASAVYDLTRTPDGDDGDLAAEGRTAALVTRAFGAVQGVTVLDLGGDPRTRSGSYAARLRTAISSYLTTGSARGVGHLEVSFAAPPRDAAIEISGDRLLMALGETREPAALSLADGALNTGPRNVYGARAQFVRDEIPSWTDLLGLRSIATKLSSRSTAPPPRSVVRAKNCPAGEGFPPPPIAPKVQPPLEGEGLWYAEGAESPAPMLCSASIRPNPARASALVRLVAIDMRRADVHARAGVEGPIPTTGPRGTGLVLPAIRKAEAPGARAASAPIIAAFAALPAASGAGAMLDGRVLVPPKPGAAAIAFDRLGALGYGSWPPSRAFDAEAFFQTADPILGTTEPRIPIVEPDRLLERSAIGFTPSGHAIYAWSKEASASELARALEAAGATYAASLVTAPMDAGFVITGAPEPAALHGIPLDESMRFSLDSGPSRSGFVLISARSADPLVPLAEGAWAPDPGTQPAPSFMPGIFSASVRELGANVHLLLLAPGRFTFRIRMGQKEPKTKVAATLPTTLSDDDQARLLVQIGLGSGRRKNPRGLAIGGVTAYKIHDDNGVLALNEVGLAVLTSAETDAAKPFDITELPLVAEAGKLRPEAREVGSMRSRAALCVLADRTTLIATTTFDSDEATTQALLDSGCARVVALDRGVHQASFMKRAGSEQAPNKESEETVLDVIEARMTGRAQPF